MTPDQIANAAAERLIDAAEELLEVARLRGDDDLPHPANDPKTWTARMQEAWNDLPNAVAEFRAAREAIAQAGAGAEAKLDEAERRIRVLEMNE